MHAERDTADSHAQRNPGGRRQAPARQGTGGTWWGSTSKVAATAALVCSLVAQGADARSIRVSTILRSSSAPETRSLWGHSHNMRFEGVNLDPSHIPSSFEEEGSSPASPQGETVSGGQGSGEGYFSANRRYRGRKPELPVGLRRCQSVRNYLSDESGSSTPSVERRTDSFYLAPGSTGEQYTRLQLDFYPEIQELQK